MSFFSLAKTAAKDILSSPSWWKQQGWVVLTEILMGFLAAWGITQHIEVLWIGLGLALVYAINSIGLWNLRVHGRKAGIGLAIGGISAIALSSWFGGDLRTVRWMGLCASIGVLLAFRDNQSVTASAWIPVRAARRRSDNLNTLTFASIFSAVVLAIALYGSGVITQTWRWWPHLMAVIGYCVFVPEMIAKMGKGMGRKLTQQTKPSDRQELSWLLKLGTIFNAMNFLGRRLIIPSLIIMLATEYFGNDDNVLPVLGATLGLISVLGTLVRAPVVLFGQVSALSLLRWGARLSLTGWGLLCTSLLLMSTQWGPRGLVLTAALIGWGIMEFTNRTWSIAYMEQLRVWTVGSRFSAARAHRRSLSRFMVRRASGGAVGCAMGGLAGPVLAPAIVIALLAGCWWVLETLPDQNEHCNKSTAANDNETTEEHY